MFAINNREISRNFKPYIIAEMSANHNGSLDRAKQSITAAKRAGVDAVKMQSYTADTMTLDSPKADFQITTGRWQGYSLYQLYQEAHTPFEWHEELFDYAKSIGITIFSTPFDETAVELLEKIQTPAYKIASFEMVDLPLIRCVAETQKPVFMSTGMASLEEIAEAIETIKATGNNQILLFHCISSYPAPLTQSHLSIIQTLKKEFAVEVGLSDHSITNTAAIAAVALGATAIEKHFKLDAHEEGPDSSFSLLPKQLHSLVQDCGDTWLALGSGTFTRAEVELDSQKFRRSLYFVKSKKIGETVVTGDVRRIRPGYGIAPKYADDIVGKTLKCAVECGDPVLWTVFA